MANCITVNNLSKTILKTRVLSNLNLVLESSCVHAIIGPNGAGKTTLMRVLAGLLEPTDGTIEYFDNKVDAHEIKNLLSYFPQEPSLYPDLSCQEHLEFFKELYRINRTDFIARSEKLYKVTGMSDFKERRAGNLSGGMYKKLGIMCVLLSNPKVLLLDEPTIGVDPLSRYELWNMIYSFVKGGLTVVMSTCYMDEAERANKIYVLNGGKLIADGKLSDILEKRSLNKIEELFLQNAKQNSFDRS
jgi:ABC-2 type transport system ATP-binding protein